jgi:hypothetical protein
MSHHRSGRVKMGGGGAAGDDEAVMAQRGRVLRLGTKRCLKGERSMMFGVGEVLVDSGEPIECKPDGLAVLGTTRMTRTMPNRMRAHVCRCALYLC